MKSPIIFLIGTGIGKDSRGFESHILDLFDKVKNEVSFEAYLVKGAGSECDNEIRIANLHRKSFAAKLLGALFGKNAHVIQQFTFFLGLIPALYRLRPTTLYLGEPGLFNQLYRWRNFSSMNFRMVFYTGGNTVPLKMGSHDFLQLVTPVMIPLAKTRGIQPEQMKIIPHFVNFDKQSGNYQDVKNALRKKLNIRDDQLILISVGALDSSVKRMDYVIDEVSHLSVPCFLIMLGEFEDETPTIRKLAEKKLGGNFYLNKVSRDDLPDFYKASDIFLLASLSEGFGLVTIEALLYGLPVLVHQHDVSRFVLGDMAFYSDLSKKENLKQLIEHTIPNAHNADSEARKKYVGARYSWDCLKQDYLKMLTDSANKKIRK